MTHFKDQTIEEVEVFRTALEEVLDQGSINEFYLGRTGLDISIDKDWYAFMIKKIGYNSKENRFELPFGINLINRSAKILEDQWLQDQDGPPGGRVFIDFAGVKRKDGPGREIQVCTWNWPVKSRIDTMLQRRTQSQQLT